MTEQTIADFVGAYADGSITNDATWRAYQIEAVPPRKYAQKALKELNYPQSEFSYGQVAADWGIGSAASAKHLLRLWYIWRELSNNRRIVGIQLRSKDNGHRRKTKNASGKVRQV